MKPVDCARLADELLPAVLEAGRIEMCHHKAGRVAFERKPDKSLVTAADREAEAVLLDALARVESTIPVIAEERVSAGVVVPPADAFFLVDPLDGTRGFVEGSGEFTINIGLIVCGEPVFGLIYAPALSEFYVTLGPARSIETRLAPEALPASLSACGLVQLHTREPQEGLVAYESRSHHTREDDAFLERLGIANAIPLSSSLKFCRIAQGKADCYARMGPTSEWDTAAGHAILAAAGGTVTTRDGAPLRYGKADLGYINPSFVAWGRRPLPARDAASASR